MHRDFEIARNIDSKRLQRRDVQRMQALGADNRLAGRIQISRTNATLVQLNQRRQKAGQRFPASSRRNQQCGSPRLDPGQELELMRARLPATSSEPALEDVGQSRSGVEKIARRFHDQLPATTISPCTGYPFSVRVEELSMLIGFKPALANAASTCALACA